MNYRNPKVLAHARGQSCQFCNALDGTVVAAHSNQGRHGKGMSIKAHDCFVAYLCMRCHTAVDQGRGPQAVRVAIWQQAHERSVPLFRHLLDEEGERILMGVPA